MMPAREDPMVLRLHIHCTSTVIASLLLTLTIAKVTTLSVYSLDLVVSSLSI